MARSPEKYFVVKHDLASLRLLPGFIWNSVNSHKERPRGFASVNEGDEWVAFAYTSDEEATERLSLVTGFYSCTRPLIYGPLPPAAQMGKDSNALGWQIRGAPIVPRLASPVEIPPLATFFDRNYFTQNAVTEISRAEFNRIRAHVLKHTGKGSIEPDDDAPKYVEATLRGASSREARECLRRLVAHVLVHQGTPLTPLTYEDLASRIGRLNKHGKGHGHGMGRVLGIMGHTLEQLAGDWGERVPMIQCLVVNKAGRLRGLPDDGIKEFWGGYSRWSRQEKRAHVLQEYRRIEEFGSRWNQVLAKLDLAPIALPPESPRRFGRGGESPEHRRLQQFMRQHPELVGADANWLADENYSLPSLDEIDLLFRSDGACVAVEVKSKISDRVPEDYERGIYQTIKYGALLAAMHSAGRTESRPSITAVLVLEGTLPHKYRPLAKRLGVRVIENVTPEGE